MLCDDPECLCHPRPEKPWQQLKLVLRGSKPDQVCQIDHEDAQLDIVFDLVANTLIFREVIKDPEFPDAGYILSMRIHAKYLYFDNLQGLPDSSLLLTMRVRNPSRAANKSWMRIKQTQFGFSPNVLHSRLYHNLVRCNWDEQHLELFMHADRIRGWKTIALIVKTFKRITPENWYLMVLLERESNIAGLDWMELEKDVMLNKKKNQWILEHGTEEEKEMVKEAIKPPEPRYFEYKPIEW